MCTPMSGIPVFCLPEACYQLLLDYSTKKFYPRHFKSMPSASSCSTRTPSRSKQHLSLPELPQALPGSLPPSVHFPSCSCDPGTAQDDGAQPTLSSWKWNLVIIRCWHRPGQDVGSSQLLSTPEPEGSPSCFVTLLGFPLFIIPRGGNWSPVSFMFMPTSVLGRPGYVSIPQWSHLYSSVTSGEGWESRQGQLEALTHISPNTITLRILGHLTFSRQCQHKPIHLRLGLHTGHRRPLGFHLPSPRIWVTAFLPHCPLHMPRVYWERTLQHWCLSCFLHLWEDVRCGICPRPQHCTQICTPRFELDCISLYMDLKDLPSFVLIFLPVTMALLWASYLFFSKHKQVSWEKLLNAIFCNFFLNCSVQETLD